MQQYYNPNNNKRRVLSGLKIFGIVCASILSCAVLVIAAIIGFFIFEEIKSQKTSASTSQTTESSTSAEPETSEAAYTDTPYIRNSSCAITSPPPHPFSFPMTPVRTWKRF